MINVLREYKACYNEFHFKPQQVRKFPSTYQVRFKSIAKFNSALVWMLFWWLEFCDFARQAYFSIRHEGLDFARAYFGGFVALGVSGSTQWKNHSKNNYALCDVLMVTAQGSVIVTRSKAWEMFILHYQKLRWCPTSHEQFSWHFTR